jgi:hypothetical protein
VVRTSVGKRSGGPKGLGNLAQALAWVGVIINATNPEGAEEIVI